MEQKYFCDCGRVYTNPQAFNGHKSHCIVHLTKTGRLHIRQEIDETTKQKKSEGVKKARAIQTLAKLRVWQAEKHYCERCGKLMLEKYASGRFCSRSCANGRPHTEEEKLRISDSIKRIDGAQYFYKSDGTPFHDSASGRELEFRHYLTTKYPEYNFRYGCLTKYEGTRLCPDIWSEKLHIIIEYDGEWHFSEIHNQLVRRQESDRRLLRFVNSSDYRLIRIDEKEVYSIKDLEKDIFINKDKVILIGSRYAYLDV